ncbi:succinate--CoA ligase subunit alpha [Campylobacter sp. CCUG 57310]|uniref:succinate--CoA ligase subunit alpha n=1 Tax=Campylobacter sp. CCUG 57310 TaxID=2517362 RepID=UPI0015655A69|nr:succinate--CoA ligase subunit alpha [Campylobacter sp. CCUG 57310]QKF92188.1 succinyl-CoA synthetase, alpha subunit [Campylobacter sp. CCUG 57310]
MSILIDKNTKVIVQGFTGKEGTFHSQSCLEYGTQILGGVTPFKGGQTHLNLPVFDTVEQAVNATKADTSLVFVPSAFAKDAIIEAADAGIKLAVVITEHVPVLDMLHAKAYAIKKGMRIIGPNCPGIISSNECKLGIMPSSVFKRAQTNIGIISKSGTLTYEGANEIIKAGFGISTAVGIGGDAVIGMAYEELLELFEADNDTKAILLIGEIGGDLEVKACKMIKEKISKPIVAFIAGNSAPKGRKMGHAGAIINGIEGSAEYKMKALREAGVFVVDTPTDIGAKFKEIIKI